MCLLCCRQRRLPIRFAAQILERLLVSQRPERTRFRPVLCQEPLRLRNQSVVKHLCGAPVDAFIQNFAPRIDSQPQNAKAAQPLAPLLPKFGYSLGRSSGGDLRRSLARAQAHLDRPNHLGNVIGVNAFRCRRVQSPQDAVQMLRPALLHTGPQSVAQFLVAQSPRALRPGKEPLQQSAEIKPGASADDGQVASLHDLAQNLSRLAGVFSRRHVRKRIHAIQQMMRNLRSLRRRGLGRADFKFAVHRHRVAVDDFSMKAPRDCQRQCCLSARRRAKDDYDQRLALHLRQIQLGRFPQIRHVQRALHGMYCQ